jgi:transcriptional regulator with XRE-family HTH domain
MSSARRVREDAGWTQIRVAVAAGVSLPTVRLYEADREAVRRSSREALDRVYASLAPEVRADG